MDFAYYIFETLSIAGMVGCIVAAIGATVFLAFILQHGWNDDEEAIEKFLSLLNEAKRQMLIHDDGDGSAMLYNDDRVVDAIEKRLQEGVSIHCLFNRDDNLKIKQLTAAHRKRTSERQQGVFRLFVIDDPSKWNRKRGDLHFKIIDSGTKAYLSRHSNGNRRQYNVIDCTLVPWIGRRIFAGLLKEFKSGVTVATAR